MNHAVKTLGMHALLAARPVMSPGQWRMMRREKQKNSKECKKIYCFLEKSALYL
jgi:hypothetical protein